MNKFGKYLKNFLEERDLKLEVFADKVGVSFGLVGHYVNGRRSPSYKFLEKFFKAYNVKVDDQKIIISMVESDKMPDSLKNMKEKESNKTQSNTRIPTDDDFMELPVRAKASAGNGYINLEECLYRTKIRKNGYNKDCYIIEVVGNSMEPLIQDGAYVIVDPHQTSYVKDKVFVVKFEEETYIKKVEIDEKSNLMILKSVNPDYENKYIQGAESDLVKILGRAVAYTYEGKL